MVRLTTGARIPVFWLLIVFSSVGTLLAWICLGFIGGVKDILHPPKPRIAEEHQSLGPLVLLAENYGGRYEIVGRIGKVTVCQSGFEYVVTGRITPTGFLLTVSCPLSNDSFAVEISTKTINRTDLDQFQLRSEQFSTTFSIASTDAVVARHALKPLVDQLASLGKRTLVRTIRGNLEIKRTLAVLDYDDVIGTLQVFTSMRQAFAESACSADS